MGDADSTTVSPPKGSTAPNEATDEAADEERIDEWKILKSDAGGGFYVPLEDLE